MQEFILTQLLTPIGKRRYASQANQCHLAAACIRHLTLSIRCYAASAGDPASHIFHDPAAAHTGATALSHLLSPSSPLLRELFTHVLHASPTLETAAVERLTALRADDPCGRAAEAAVAALFELLLVVFDLDGKWVQLQRRMHALVETLDAALLGRPAVALQLMQFVRYGYSSWLQAAAVRVAGTLAARDESVTATLLQFGDEAAALVHSFAGCLSSRAVVPEDPDVEDEWEEGAQIGGPGDAVGGGGSGDDAAGDGAERMEIRGLILQLMLDCADMPFPNFTQLLLGYHVSGVRLLPGAAVCDTICMCAYDAAVLHGTAVNAAWLGGLPSLLRCSTVAFALRGVCDMLAWLDSRGHCFGRYWTRRAAVGYGAGDGSPDGGAAAARAVMHGHHGGHPLIGVPRALVCTGIQGRVAGRACICGHALGRRRAAAPPHHVRHARGRAAVAAVGDRGLLGAPAPPCLSFPAPTCPSGLSISEGNALPAMLDRCGRHPCGPDPREPLVAFITLRWLTHGS